MDYSEFEIEVECPKCNYPISTSLQEVKLESTIFCPNCKTQIKLQDNDASTHQIENTINDLYSQLNNLFK